MQGIPFLALPGQECNPCLALSGTARFAPVRNNLWFSTSTGPGSALQCAAVLHPEGIQCATNHQRSCLRLSHLQASIGRRSQLAACSPFSSAGTSRNAVRVQLTVPMCFCRVAAELKPVPGLQSWAQDADNNAFNLPSFSAYPSGWALSILNAAPALVYMPAPRLDHHQLHARDPLRMLPDRPSPHATCWHQVCVVDWRVPHDAPSAAGGLDAWRSFRGGVEHGCRVA